MTTTTATYVGGGTWVHNGFVAATPEPDSVGVTCCICGDVDRVTRHMLADGVAFFAVPPRWRFSGREFLCGRRVCLDERAALAAKAVQ